jgi:hypothetical protein
MRALITPDYKLETSRRLAKFAKAIIAGAQSLEEHFQQCRIGLAEVDGPSWIPHLTNKLVLDTMGQRWN